MSLGLVGRKVGMTRIFTDDGVSVPVTVLDVSNNRVAQIKTPESDGYTAIQVAFGKRRRLARQQVLGRASCQGWRRGGGFAQRVSGFCR
jgi:ribosomal protein L3